MIIYKYICIWFRYNTRWHRIQPFPSALLGLILALTRCARSAWETTWCQSATASWAMSLGDAKKPGDQGIIGIFHYNGLIVGYSTNQHICGAPKKMSQLSIKSVLEFTRKILQRSIKSLGFCLRKRLDMTWSSWSERYCIILHHLTSMHIPILPYAFVRNVSQATSKMLLVLCCNVFLKQLPRRSSLDATL